MTAETGTWSEVLAGRHPCRVFEPAVPGDHGYSAIYLHELPPDPLLENPAFTDVWARSGLRVACPLAGPCWWTDRICPAFDPEQSGEQHVLGAVVDLVRERWSAEPPQIAICGVGMGGQGALRLAYRFPNRFPVVAAISPELDFHQLLPSGNSGLSSLYPDPEAARQDTALLQIQSWNGPRQQWFCCARTITGGGIPRIACG